MDFTFDFGDIKAGPVASGRYLVLIEPRSSPPFTNRPQ